MGGRRVRLRAWGPLAAITAAAALGGGCSGKKVTEIVVSIATDVRVPQEMEVVRFQVGRPQGDSVDPILIDHTWELVGQDPVALPITIGLLPGADPTRPIFIRATPGKSVCRW